MRHYLTLALFTALSTLFATTASAYDAGNFVVRLGAANVDPDTDSDPIEVGSTTLPNGVDVDDDTQLGINLMYMVTDHWGLELLAATPFEHDISLEDAPVEAGSTKHLPPTLTLNWFPMSGESPWQPYIGIGVNYTRFFDEDVDNELNEALGNILGLPLPVDAKLSLDDSWGIAGRAGIDYFLNDSWGLNASVWYLDISTEADIRFAEGSTSFDVDIDPWVYMLGITYRFDF